MRKNIGAILFVIVLTIVSIFYEYHDIALKRPQSVHKWRQTDCASIALNYYQNGMDFFNPETHNLTSDGGTSGKCCTSEIPILYYSVALFYKVFGYHECIFRIFNTLLFFLGLFYLFRLFRYLLNDVFWSIALTILFFTSPVLVYYGNNFLSNSSALAFSFVGWYYFVRFLKEVDFKWFLISMAVFLLAGAFKITAFFSLFAIMGFVFLELLGIAKFNGNKKLFVQPVKYLTVIFSVFLVVVSWIVYARYFNQKHDCTYFSTTLFPIWSLDKATIGGVLQNIREIWLDQYFHRSVLLFLGVCILFILVSFRRGSKLFNFAILFIFIEVVAYVVLQFWTFRDHDYYVIDSYILPVLIVIAAFDILNRCHHRFFTSPITKAVFSLFLAFNIYYAHQKIDERYNGWMNDFSKNKDIYTIAPYLRQIGISPNDTVISIPDNSNASLYLMNQKGWTEYTDARFNRGERIQYNQDSTGIQSSIDKGAKYLIVNGLSELYSKTYLQVFCTNLVGHYNNVLIFDLKNKAYNFDMGKRTILLKTNCDAELLSSDKQFFVGRTDSTLFQFGSTQSDKYARSGNYSCKLDANSPYGMTIKFQGVKEGESFSIVVWRKTNNNAKGGIVASSSPNSYYNNESTVLETDPSGWEKLFMECFITGDLNNQEFAIYLFNPETAPVYFDDLEVIRYKSNSLSDLISTPSGL